MLLEIETAGVRARRVDAETFFLRESAGAVINFDSEVDCALPDDEVSKVANCMVSPDR